MIIHTAAALIIPLLGSVHAGNVPLGGLCSANNSHIDAATHKFITDCDDKTFCPIPVNGTCQARGCRRFEFPFGYDPKDTLPPLCDHGQFCPDEGSQCHSLLDVGSPCQINRDDQCNPPPNSVDLASSQNSEGAICLLSTCMWVFIIAAGKPSYVRTGLRMLPSARDV